MPDQAFTKVSYEGAKYLVPSELMAADVRDGSTLVQQYIQEEIADAEFRAQQSKKQQDKQLESEFATISKRLTAAESKHKIIKNLQAENASLTATVKAQGKQIQALEASGADAGSASAEAREAAFSLANASTIAHGTLTELMRFIDQAQLLMADNLPKIDITAAVKAELKKQLPKMLSELSNTTNSDQAVRDSEGGQS